MSPSGRDERRAGDGDAIARLLLLAGPRPRVPAERAARVKARVHARWRERVRARRRLWRLGGLATAAALALVVTLVALGVRRPAPVPVPKPERAGWLEVATGPAPRVQHRGTDRWRRLGIGGAVPAGSRVSTGVDGRIALRLEAGVSLRVDESSRLRLVSASEIHLEQGAVYLDTGRRSGDETAVVRTPFGDARDLGTQFEVRLGTRALRVRVREGEVVLIRGDQTDTAVAGAELAVDADGGIVRRSVSVHGPEWDWVTSVAPGFDVEGRTVEALLSWVSQETGLRVQLQDAALERVAEETILHGSIEGLTPLESVAAVLPTCGLTHRVDRGTLHVERPGAGDTDP